MEGDAGGGQGEGFFIVTPWLRGEAGHAWGLSHAKHRNVVTLPRVQGTFDSGYSPDAPSFFSPEVTYITLRWAFRRLVRHRICNKGAWGAWRYTGGEWAWKPLPGKPLSPIHEPIGARDWTQAKVVTGPWGALMPGSHWDLCFLHWEERGWVKQQRSLRKLECIPKWESIFGGCVTRGRRPRTRGPSGASPSPAPSSP